VALVKTSCLLNRQLRIFFQLAHIFQEMGILPASCRYLDADKIILTYVNMARYDTFSAQASGTIDIAIDDRSGILLPIYGTVLPLYFTRFGVKKPPNHATSPHFLPTAEKHSTEKYVLLHIDLRCAQYGENCELIRCDIGRRLPSILSKYQHISPGFNVLLKNN
jgi:hypothetical protein